MEDDKVTFEVSVQADAPHGVAYVNSVIEVLMLCLFTIKL